ncbi:hypothetical protein G6F46_008205 [Rhizopus delemar]|uniref:Uncharacterized protein n=2 Tax=Rhizopus TaxID=4842 RepID=A0A9P7CJS3_9FUNG|nr:hypothetical protein G6F43_001794 [Rhizopus delemar]KAG1535936.1 hypothetical protein G6F51_011250 [Rhizopus arrhizus]KAG1448460.1 hypothetical protein G6F55_010640 [Rhizopus delemar]KAG1492411.1 hypothetical protein G6F54_009332 [Rhizopus delemar]KAG1501821.1 hypothetical protein G6F53_010998 [Rhizopus delemar]
MPKTPPLLLPTNWSLDDNAYNDVHKPIEEESSEGNNENDYMLLKQGEESDFIQQQSQIHSATLFQKADTQQHQQQEEEEEHSWEETIQELQSEFQSYMEEYKQIKKDLDMKKKALYLEIIERKEYLERRGADIYQKWDVLKEFI